MVDSARVWRYNTYTETTGVYMKVLGARYIKAKPWFGAVEKDAKPVKYDFTEIEKVMRTWTRGEAQ
jgi:hypothetical protein